MKPAPARRVAYAHPWFSIPPAEPCLRRRARLRPGRPRRSRSTSHTFRADLRLGDIPCPARGDLDAAPATALRPKGPCCRRVRRCPDCPGPAAQPLGRRLLLSCLQRSLTRLAPGASGSAVERRLAACALSARRAIHFSQVVLAPCRQPATTIRALVASCWRGTPTIARVSTTWSGCAGRTAFAARAVSVVPAGD